MKILAEFENGIPEGMTILLDNQKYKFVGMEPYQTKSGAMTELSLWASNCATCGIPITVKHTRKLSFQFVRRCDEHKKVGQRVTPRKGKRS